MSRKSVPVKIPAGTPAADEPISSLPLPTAARVLLLLSALGVLLLAARLWIVPVQNSDLWFHLKTGEWILQNRQIPTGDVFSWTAAGTSWIVNAWLSDILLWMIYRFGGASGLLMLRLLVGLAVFSLTTLACRQISGRWTLSLLLAFLAMVGAFYRVTLRPELFTFALLSATLIILYQYKFRQSDSVWWLVPIGLLWPNLHMGFIVAVAVLGSFLAGEALAALYYKNHKQPVPEDVIAGDRLKRLGIVALMMTAATLANPYLWNAWLFTAKLSGQFGSIVEWEPLLKAYGTIELLSLAASGLLAVTVLTALAVSRKPKDYTGFFLAVFFIVMAFRFSRQLAQFCMAAPLVASAASRSFRFPEAIHRLAHRFSHPVRAAAGAGGLLSIVILLNASVFFFKVTEPGKSRMGFGLDRSECSENAVRFIRENGLLGARLFNTLEQGGWLILKLAPEQKVFIDGRIDMYGLARFNEYKELATSPDLGMKLEAMGVDYCCLRFPNETDTTGTSPALTLSHDPEWALVFFDDSGMIFVRKDSSRTAKALRKEYRILNPLLGTNPGVSNPAADPAQVMREVNRTLRECPDSDSAHLTSGVALRLIGKPGEAIQRLETAKRIAVHWAPEMFGTVEDYLGAACVDMNDYQSAVRHFRKAARYAGSGEDSRLREAAARNNLGFALFKTGCTAEAEIELKRALKLNPEFALAYMTLAEIHLSKKRYKEALAELENAHKYVTDGVEVQVLTARCLAATGDAEQALILLESAAQDDANAVRKAAGSPEFNSLKSNSRFRQLADLQ